jgi:hypothetical protein
MFMSQEYNVLVLPHRFLSNDIPLTQHIRIIFSMENWNRRNLEIINHRLRLPPMLFFRPGVEA